jgi:chemotaxis protein methyltransferase CheR
VRVAASAQSFQFVRDFVYRHAAIVLDDGQGYLVDSRLGALAQREGFSSVDDLVVRLRLGEPGELRTKVVEAMTTNETSFFRDVAPFEALRRRVLPELARARAGARSLRLWSAAASTGQEPYSVALLVREHFAQLDGWDVRILGTDINGAVLDRAREGSYRQLEVNRGLPAPLLVKYFERQGLDWRLAPAVRRLVQFEQLNLLDPWTKVGPCDVIFLRNVLIYFDLGTRKQILRRVREVLRPDGYLFLGCAETPLGIDEAFERVEFEKTFYYRPLRRSEAP